MKTVTIKEAAQMLLSHDNILILMHKSPDGDAIGSAYGLCAALRNAGKNAQPVCSDPIPEKYGYITDKLPFCEFEPEYIVSVDLADTQLFGEALECYKDKVSLCIDHHGSNTGFAEYGIIDASAGACAQILVPIIREMGVTVDSLIADAIFTGITTDTGCFKFSNASADSYRIAADMIDCGARSAMINRIMFDTKTRQHLALEKMALESLRYFENGSIAMITVTMDMMKQTGAQDCDLDGIASLPRQIEGVKIGITVKEKEPGFFKMSVRTTDDVNASKICALLNGGGHRAAAGCSVKGTREEAEGKILEAAKKIFSESEI